MDPIFGLPCVKESRRMDSARSRNKAQEKMLSRKVEALHMDQRNRSSKRLVERGSVEAFRSRVDHTPARLSDMPAGLSRAEREQYKRLFLRKDGLSMTLGELDQRLIKKKVIKPPSHTPFLTDLDSPRPGEGGGEQVVAEEEAGKYLVSSAHGGTCLPINRKKHAMKAALDRATTTDVKFSSGVSKTAASTPLSATAPKRDTSSYLYNDHTSELTSPVQTRLEVDSRIPFSKSHNKSKWRRAQLKTPRD